MTPVRIRIVTEFDYGSEKEETRNEYGGKRFEKDGKTILRYEERLYEGAEPVMTTLTVAADEVRLHRKGTVGGDMLFREDVPCEFFYRSGFGNIPMEIRTRRLVTGRDGESLSVEIYYRLYTEGQKNGDIHMKIAIS